jgi:hypothetical protein
MPGSIPLRSADARLFENLVAARAGAGLSSCEDYGQCFPPGSVLP